jgi:uncharacterized protein (UPF0548 family)
VGAVISLRRPTDQAIERYRTEREVMQPSFATPGEHPPGFHVDHAGTALGSAEGGFERARAALETWAVHAGAGVSVVPDDAPLVPGTTVAIVTRQLGLWIVASCRITERIDTPTAFGFVYATLPGHPERGEERFVVTKHPDGECAFDIDVTWRSDALLARLGSPVSARVQRRATEGYLAAMRRACATASGSKR